MRASERVLEPPQFGWGAKGFSEGHDMRGSGWAAGILLAVMAAWLLPAAPGAAQVRETVGSIPLMHGGIGVDAREAMQQAQAQYNLRLQFATQGSGEYLAEVRIKIIGAQGTGIVETLASGPWLYAKLPPGSYTITAASEGRTLTHPVTIKHGWQGWVFRFEPRPVQ